MDFNKIVKKMWKKCWKVLFRNDIFELIDPEKKERNKNKISKIIYRLKAENIIINLKSGVYIVPDNEDKNLNKIDLEEKYFLKLLKKYISYYVRNEYYISGQKALEIHNKDFSIPEKIFITTRNLNKKISLKNTQIIFKTISWKKNWKKVNLYSLFSSFVVRKKIDNLEFKVSSLELALVESALIGDTINWFNISLLTKTIKKYWEVFDFSVFYKIWEYKFIMSFNRLKELSKNINQKLYKTFLDIIKKNWWLFIWEWLRWI
jgi:hypothetical protein